MAPVDEPFTGGARHQLAPRHGEPLEVEGRDAAQRSVVRVRHQQRHRDVAFGEIRADRRRVGTSDDGNRHCAKLHILRQGVARKQCRR